MRGRHRGDDSLGPEFLSGNYDERDGAGGPSDPGQPEQSHRRRQTVSRRTLLLGIGATAAGTAAFMQRAYPPLHNWIEGKFTDTGVPEFRRLSWIGVSGKANWAVVSRDPNQRSSIPSRWTKVGVFATPAAAYWQQFAELGSDAVQAFAIPHGDGMQAGVQPDGGTLLNYLPGTGGERMLAVAARVGEGSCDGLIGFADRHTEHFIPAAAGTVALQQTTTVDHLAHDFPGILLV